MKAHGRSQLLTSEPFGIRLPWRPREADKMMRVEVTLEFQSHYGEPPITRQFVIHKDGKGTKSLATVVLIALCRE